MIFWSTSSPILELDTKKNIFEGEGPASPCEAGWRLLWGWGQTEQHHGHQLRKCFLPYSLYRRGRIFSFYDRYIVWSELYIEGLTNFSCLWQLETGLRKSDWYVPWTLDGHLEGQIGALPGIITLGWADPRSLEPWKPSRGQETPYWSPSSSHVTRWTMWS